MFDAAFGVRIVLAPEAHELVQMVRTQDGPVTRQVIEVVHDDGHEQIENLRVKIEQKQLGKTSENNVEMRK